jgi:hypothetical protein
MPQTTLPDNYRRPMGVLEAEVKRAVAQEPRARPTDAQITAAIDALLTFFTGQRDFVPDALDDALDTLEKIGARMEGV